MANARLVAVKALLKINHDKAYSNITLDSFFADFNLDSKDKALATALVYGVLDRKITLDYIIGKFSKTPLKKISPLTLEAISLGHDSTIRSLRSWTEWPSFVVLRLTELSKRERAVVADYAERNLKQIPYSLTAGMWDEEAEELAEDLQEGEALGGTQCAHLIWYAYNHFGYDLDSNGGMLVTPKDLYESSLLEMVQVYGVKIE